MASSSSKFSIVQGREVPDTGADIIVIVDVIRAFATTLAAFLAGVEQIYLTSSHEEAFRMRETDGLLLVGERLGLKIEGYDFGNSPVDLTAAKKLGRAIVLNTTNDVAAARSALVHNPKHCLVTGFGTAKATGEFIRKVNPNGKTLIVASHPESDDDVACGEYIGSIIENRPLDIDLIKKRILGSKVAHKFLDDAQVAFNRADLEFCIQPADVSFVQKVFNCERITVKKESL